MFYYLFLPFESIFNYIERGGPVLFILFIVAIGMWCLLIERYFFIRGEMNAVISNSIEKLKAHITLHDWLFKQVLKSEKSSVAMIGNTNFRLIKGLIALCPLLGLLGTVTGMISVFDVMAYTGTGSPRAMASGVAKATLPTMTGLIISISGLFAITYLEKLLNDKVTEHKSSVDTLKHA